MNLTFTDMIAIASALAAVMMVGSRHLRLNLELYGVQTFIIAWETALIGAHKNEPQLYLVALAIASIKAIGIPIFLHWIIRRIGVENDSGTMMPAPLAMHLSIGLFGLAFMLSRQLPPAPGSIETAFGASAGLSLLFTGLLLMLTRKVAVSQIIGFLTMENGIFIFAMTQTAGMPMLVEMGILLDVLVGVMITGLLLFGIKKSFEHIDVTQLAELKD